MKCLDVEGLGWEGMAWQVVATFLYSMYIEGEVTTVMWDLDRGW